MVEAPEVGEKDDRVAAFEERIAKLQHDGVAAYPPLGHRTPWADATEQHKLEEIVWESWTVLHGSSVAGRDALAMIERAVDYAGLPSAQRELLQDLRARLDAGEFVEAFPDQKDRVALALGRIVGVGQFEQMIEWMKDKEDRPWAEVPDDMKVCVLVDAALEAGPPGDYALRAIEREVDYVKLSPWRREAMEGLHQRLGRGELDGENRNPSQQDDNAGFALRLAEFEARVEDSKRLGALDDQNRRWPWGELSEDQKLDSLEFDIRALNLDNESRAYEIVGREVDLTRVPERRRSHVQSHQQPEVMDASRDDSGISESRIVEAQPKLPSPSDIAKDKQPYTMDPFQDLGHGRDR